MARRMNPGKWDPPSDQVTTPDQIDAGALGEIGLLADERIARCWRTPAGFLVLTNLRCVHVYRRRLLFAPGDWHAEPSVFFYDMAPPRVLGERYVELAEATDEAPAMLRVPVPNVRSVRDEIAAARPAGRAEWERRRRSSEASVRRPAPAIGDPRVVHEVIREVIKVRCSYCGNLMDEGAPRCPACGAPQR